MGVKRARGKGNGFRNGLAAALVCLAVLAVVIPVVNGGLDVASDRAPQSADSAREAVTLEDASSSYDESGSDEAGVFDESSNEWDDPGDTGIELDDGEVIEGDGTLGTLNDAGVMILPDEVVTANEPDYSGVAHVSDELLIQPSEGHSVQDVLDVLDGYGVQAQVVDEGESFVELALPQGTSIEHAASEIDLSGTVEYVGPDRVLSSHDDESQVEDEVESPQVFTLEGSGDDEDASGRLLETEASATDDPKLSEQWALKSMKAYAAWNTVKTEGSVTVAVLDEGFNVSHPDLKGNIVNPWNPISSTSDVSETSGEDYHGTHAAGIIAATANNALGVAGVSYNAKVMPIKIYAKGATETTASNLAKGIEYAVSKKSAYNVRVINISLGASDDTSPYTWNDAVTKAIDKANAAGIVVVCSAGNYSTETPPYTCYPADYPSAVGVMNLKQSGSSVILSGDSNYNAKNTFFKGISAPGTSIYSTYGAKAYKSKSGTSMAAPQVSGVLALVFAKYPNLTAAQATSRLYSTAADLTGSGNLSGTTFDYHTGFGEVDAAAAVSSSSIYFKKSASVLKKGSSSTFKASGSVSSWKSSNTKVVTVSGGTVKAVGGGTAIVSATGASNKAEQVVTVYDPVISGSKAVVLGATSKLTLSCSIPSSWKWTSSNAKIASVSSKGVVTGKKIGQVTITATNTANSAIKVTKTVSVIPSRSTIGATKVPVGATTTLSIPSGCKLKLESGYGSYASLNSKGVFKGLKANAKVKIGLYKGTTRLCAYNMNVYALSGTYGIRSAKNTSFYLDVAGASVEDGANVIIWKGNGGYNQRFRFTYSNGYYTIKCVKSGKLVDVEGCTKADGGNVLQWRSNKGANQQWAISVDASNRLSFKNRNSGKLLDVAGGTMAAGVNVLQWRQNGGLNQKFKLYQY